MLPGPVNVRDSCNWGGAGGPATPGSSSVAQTPRETQQTLSRISMTARQPLLNLLIFTLCFVCPGFFWAFYVAKKNGRGLVSRCPSAFGGSTARPRENSLDLPLEKLMRSVSQTKDIQEHSETLPQLQCLKQKLHPPVARKQEVSQVLAQRKLHRTCENCSFSLTFSFLST